VGVYFNDATTGKMDTFLHVDLAASVRIVARTAPPT
jgi:hypothetical protein